MTTIPSTFHFVYGLRPQTEAFPLQHHLAVASCAGVNPGARIVMHLHERPWGEWWERTEGLVEIAAIEPDAIGLDWTVNLTQARQRTQGRVAPQGNIDPTVLFAPEAAIRAQVRQVLDSYAAGGGSDGHVFNLGHGISQFTPPESVSVLVDEVHRHSRQLRAAAVAPAA